MAQQVSGDLTAAIIPPQLKLCPYDEEEPAIWFRLIEAQFTLAGIRSQKIKYVNDVNALANLPKKVFQDILDTVNAYNQSDHPFDLKAVLLGQFGKSNWQSYFELLRMPWESPASSPAFSWVN
jgi:hypothetical protein